MNHSLLFSLSAATVLLASSMDFDAPTVSKNILPTEVSPEPTVSPKKIWVEAEPVFYKNETIELRFAAPNAPYLGMIDPAGHFFYLVYPKEEATGGLKPVVGSADFTQMGSLKISTASFRADPYTYGVSQNRRVFTRSGKYTFIMGENLHVDDPGELNNLVVEYIHQNRPANLIAVVD